MSFKSLVNKLMKEGKSKEAATKIAGKVASEKMKGAGSGPTAKQKARMKKSPSKMKKSMANMKDKSMAKMKKSPAKKPLVGKQKNLPEHLKKAILDAPAKMLSKSGMKMMKEGSPAKKKEKVKFVKTGKTIKKGPAAGFAEIKGSKDMPRKRAERKERKGKGFIDPKLGDSPAKMNGDGKKVKGSYTKSTKRQKITGTKTVSPKKENYLTKITTDAKTGKETSRVTKPAKTTKITEEQYNNQPPKGAANAKAAREAGYMYNYNTRQFEPTPNKAGAEKRKKSGFPERAEYEQFKKDYPQYAKSPTKKSKQRVEQDYARNAIADYKAGKKKEGNYEKKKALELAAGESGVMMKKSPGMMKTPMMKYDNSPALIKKAPTMMKTNQMGGGVAAKDSAAPARQLKKLGSIISKHMKSN